MSYFTLINNIFIAFSTRGLIYESSLLETDGGNLVNFLETLDEPFSSARYVLTHRDYSEAFE